MQTRINRIEILSTRLPFSQPFRIALAVMDSIENIFVRLHDSDGITGIGEACPSRFVTGESPETAFEAARQYGALLLGKNPLEIDARLAELEHYMLKNPSMRCAFDLALYDLLAKHAGLPLFALLGGAKRAILSNRTLGIDTPQAMAQKAAALLEHGVQALKIKLGSNRLEDIARVHAIRQAAGPGVQLRLDANQAWDEAGALAILQAVAGCDVQVCEQPLPAWNEAGLKRLRQRSPIPIMADESVFDSHDAFRLAASGAVDFLNIKLAKSAGIHDALKINAVGAAAGVPCMLGGMAETLVGVSAGAHMICACPNIQLADLDSPFHFSEDPTTGGVDFQPGGRVTLRDAPGHGADLKPEWIERSHRIVLD
jgi:L-alanine-DL-glutamate epimerase-like enolase superfamily enzyme